MKKRILGILTVMLALSMVFTMVSCGGDSPSETKTYTITYNANGWTGSLTSRTTIAQNAQIGNKLVNLTDTAEQQFLGWALTSDGDDDGKGGDAITTTYKVESNIDLYVLWADAIDTGEPITITYNKNGWTGSGVPSNVTGKSGTQLENDQFPTLTDTDTQRFLGWALTGSGTANNGTGGVRLTAPPTPSGNIILYVLWQAKGTIPPPPPTVTVTFNPNYTGSEPNWTVTINEDSSIDPLPSPKTRQGWAFLGWYNLTETTQFTVESTFPVNTTVYGKWIEDTITNPEEAFELLYLTNGGYAIYQFDIPEGNTLADYDTLAASYKLSEAALTIWDINGIRGIRLYGVYLPNTTLHTADNADYDLPDIKYFDLNTQNTPYRIVNPATAGIKDGAEADKWFDVTYDLAGDGNAENDANKPASQTGTVYFALGISCQTTSGGVDRSKAFLHLIKDIKLLPTEDAEGAEEIVAKKPAATYAQFLAYNDPIVFEWRGEPTEANYANPPLPAMPEDTFDRGDPPAAADLRQVELGELTYVNKGNPNNQTGWVSFTEAGRANDQSSTVSSTVAFENFKNAWYLVLETEKKPDGTLSLIWMGDAGTWMSNATTTTSGGAVDGVTEITGNDDEGYTVKIFLPKALLQYGTYFNDNVEWAGLSLGYWGASVSNVPALGITKAYLLVDKNEVVGPTTGISLGLSFVLGSAPAGGDLFDDIALEDNLTITTVTGLTDFIWYVDGVKNATSSDVLTIPAASGTVSLQAKRDGKWVSQAVDITVTE